MPLENDFEDTRTTIQRRGNCRASLFIVDSNEEREQDGRISTPCGGCTRGNLFRNGDLNPPWPGGGLPAAGGGWAWAAGAGSGPILIRGDVFAASRGGEACC